MAFQWQSTDTVESEALPGAGTGLDEEDVVSKDKKVIDGRTVSPMQPNLSPNLSYSDMAFCCNFPASITLHAWRAE